MRKNITSLLPWYAIIIAVLASDQVSKWWALSQLRFGMQEWLPFLQMRLQFNAGAAFGLLSEAGGWQRWFFSILTVIISTALFIWLHRLPVNARLMRSGLSLIIGGALGNLWDRIELGHVTDFIAVHWNNYYWPTFNVADSAISIGAMLLLIDLWSEAREAKKDAH